MKIINIREFPKDYDYNYGDLTEFDSYDYDRLQKDGVTILVYWYAAGSYEGAGHALFQIGNLWTHHDLGHCSCYGPLENLEYKNMKPLTDLYNSCSDELKKQLKPLYDRAKVFDLKSKMEIILK